MNILIYGSCVSRDAFELIASGHTVTGFIARCPISTLFKNPAAAGAMRILDPKNEIPKGFPRRMIEMNLNAQAPEFLKQKAAESDALLIDMIDERLPIFDFNGEPMCLSSELAKVYKPDEDQKILMGSDRRKMLTSRGINALCTMAKRLKLPIILNKAKWSEDPASGRESDFSAVRNAELEEIYTQFCAWGVDTINYENHTFKPDTQHKWGATPYHYTEATYRQLMNELMLWEINNRKR